MPVNAASLARLAGEYASGMTSIRGRRVQRLLNREFAGAEHVLQSTVGAAPAVLGLSNSGAALCVTDGTGKQASVIKWLHGSNNAHISHFDLLKDSLPLLNTESVPLVGPPREALLNVPPGSVVPGARDLVAMALRALPQISRDA